MWPLLELKGVSQRSDFPKRLEFKMFWGALLCIGGSIDHKGGRDKRWKRNSSPIRGLRGHVFSNDPLGPLLVVSLISKRKSTFWRDWSVKKKTPCCKHSPSSISMLLRIVRKGEKTHTARTVYTKRLFFSDSTSKSNECVSLRTGITRHHWQPSKFMSPKWYSIQIV